MKTAFNLINLSSQPKLILFKGNLANQSVRQNSNENAPAQNITSYPKVYYVNKKQPSFKGLEEDDPIKWAKTWDREKVKAELEAKKEEELDGAWFWQKGKIKRKYELELDRQTDRVTTILRTCQHTQEKIDKLEKAQMSDEQRKKEIAKAEKELESIKKIKSGIEVAMVDPNANIDKTIAGYDQQKQKIRDKFLAPIHAEKRYEKEYQELANKKIKVPGDEYNLLGREMTNAIAKRLNITDGDEYNLLGREMTLGKLYEINNKDEDKLSTKELRLKAYGNSYFAEDLKQIEEAKFKADNTPIPKGILFYGTFGTGKTTFARAVASEAGMVPDELDPSSDSFRKDVENSLNKAKERYINEGKRTAIIINEAELYLDPNIEDVNLANIGRIKNILDNCSNKPNERQKTASAATFFFTTNFPRKMEDQGILGRDGRISIVIPVEPASGNDMKAVLKHHIKRVNPDKKEFDYENYDYTKLLEKLEPSAEKGAFSNDKIRTITDVVHELSESDKTKTFEEHLNRTIPKAHRDISAKRLKEYYDDYESIHEDFGV